MIFSWHQEKCVQLQPQKIFKTPESESEKIYFESNFLEDFLLKLISLNQ